MEFAWLCSHNHCAVNYGSQQNVVADYLSLELRLKYGSQRCDFNNIHANFSVNVNEVTALSSVAVFSKCYTWQSTLRLPAQETIRTWLPRRCDSLRLLATIIQIQIQERRRMKREDTSNFRNRSSVNPHYPITMLQLVSLSKVRVLQSSAVYVLYPHIWSIHTYIHRIKYMFVSKHSDKIYVLNVYLY